MLTMSEGHFQQHLSDQTRPTMLVATCVAMIVSNAAYLTITLQFCMHAYHTFTEAHVTLWCVRHQKLVVNHALQWFLAL